MISVSRSEAMGLAQSIDYLNATEKQLMQAYHQSIGRAVRRASSRVVHEIASHLDLPKKALRRRLFVYKQDNKEKGCYKIWCGLNDVPIDHLGTPKRAGADILVKGIRSSNAYITKTGRVRLRGTGALARTQIDEKVESLLNKLLPYYFYQYFEKAYTELLKHKYGR